MESGRENYPTSTTCGRPCGKTRQCKQFYQNISKNATCRLNSRKQNGQTDRQAMIGSGSASEPIGTIKGGRKMSRKSFTSVHLQGVRPLAKIRRFTKLLQNISKIATCKLNTRKPDEQTHVQARLELLSASIGIIKGQPFSTSSGCCQYPPKLNIPFYPKQCRVKLVRNAAKLIYTHTYTYIH